MHDLGYYSDRDIDLYRNQISSISPYTANFIDYIDPKLREIVTILCSKNYLPAYSCQGHSIVEPRYLVLAFGDLAQRNIFKKSLETLPSRHWIKLEELETLSIEKIRGRIHTWQSVEEETRGFNFLYCRNYKSYCFLKIVIAKDSHYPHGGNFSDIMSFYFKKIYFGAYNYFFREKATKLFAQDLQKAPFFLG